MSPKEGPLRMTQSTDDQILRYLKDQSALDQNMGRRVKDIMTGIALDVENVRIALHRMLGNGLAETSNANMISGGVPASFRPDKEQREGWQPLP